MTKFYLLFIALWALVGLCVGQIVQSGQCDPNIALQEDLTLEQFEGTWYEIQRTESPEQYTDCAQFDLIFNEDYEDTLLVNHYGVRKNFEENARGIAKTSNIPAKLILDIPTYDGPIDFWVLAGGNETYTIVYSCKDVSPTSRSIHLWILGKGRSYATIMIQRFIDTLLINTFGFGLDSLQYVDHSDTACYALPEIKPGDNVILPGKCNANIPVQQSFDVEAFKGTWHQIASYHSENSDGNCVRAEYKIGNGVVDVVNSQVINEKLLTIEGTATVNSTDGSAKLKVILNVAPDVQVEQELWVLSTDYKGYAVSYSCEDLENDEKRIYSWVLSRERVLNTESQLKVNNVIDSFIELNENYYKLTDHSPASCFYFPEPSDQAVVFRGQCEMEIPPVKQSFDPVQYMGLWHNIELYPAPFQDGTCSNAFYELRDSRVDVRNTQVQNGTLDTINGFAVLVSEDGSAKLEVTFPVAGTDVTITTDYWVLETNYNSYAFVYSCRNIDSDSMQVSSWKLSRTKTLSDTDNTAIERVINTTKVLDQRYFKEVNQSVAGCSFIPIPEEEVPVVFPGRCDPNLAMEHFDYARFARVWYEIEAYPKLEQRGQCIKHEYKLLGTTEFNLTSSSVDDQFLVETRGLVTSFNNTGRLSITIRTDGEDITIPFWIIDTDYTNYALAYSCVDRDDGLRSVWSWKLSNSKELSNDAKTAIANAMENIDVLDEIYYWPVDQSDRACFTLPVLEAGAPIILDGVCDNEIDGIPDFNAIRFSGRWRLIQSYPFDSQTGTCNEVTFNQIDGNVLTLDVNHEQVLDRTLNSVSGIATIGSDGKGTLDISFPSSGAESAKYKILDTDYTSYALLYRCDNINALQRRVWSWKLSRSNTLGNDANAAINTIINRIDVLNNRYYSAVDRTEAGCFYFPEVNNNNTPVRFRGQCDMSINVVKDFNPFSYQGLWHDIQSYPEVFQNGTCNNALYTLDDDGVDVYNTQVVNQKLDTMRGRAVLASTDGRAKLDVTFNVMGMDVTTSYWVLDTDFTSYSLVYSCRNVDEEYYQVSSWKLSRNRSLSISANLAIDAAIKDIPVLDDRYYLRRDQTESGCFYFPEPEENKPVVFPGQCDEDIDTVQNFNFTEFKGTWHEIEAYPKDQETGECVNHRYTNVTGQPVDLVSSSIRDQIRSFTSGQVTGSNGRLTISIVSDGLPITIPFWIIDVKYDDYALAYSCVNRNDSHRAVYSWKLSRTKQLSSTARSAIDNAITAIDVLDNRYYEGIDQSDEACFYLPDFAPGEPAIFPGKCDEGIRGVANFDVQKLIGHWRVIQSYPSEAVGTCNEATYSSSGHANNLTVNAVHAYVVNQTLTGTSGILSVSSTDKSGALKFIPNGGEQSVDYVVLAIDYDSYAFVYQCENILGGQDQFRKVTSWKLGRNNTLDQTANDEINAVIDRINVLNARYFYNVDRSEAGCFYFPEVNDNAPVRFRGRCNESIPALSNFNPDAYQGLWHDIQSYPEVFQNGTCSNAVYTLDDNGVDVYNTQVVNQELDIMRGRAVLASTDGSAKLDVTFNVMGMDVTTNYWVLDTDYTSYSLVYSCRNVGEEYYQVSSWKLSRNRSLSISANLAIDAAIKDIPVLDDRYYLGRDQTESGCFYFPEPEENKPVVFPGQCDEDIDTVQNFNFTEFKGTWHEIEAYPKDQETGECVNHRYTNVTGQPVDLVSSSIRDQIRSFTSGQVTGSNGRLTISIVSDGLPITIPFWIIDVKYDDYALAYSCVNRNDSHRAVYSWKLSRTKQLSSTARSAIDNAITAIDVLDNRYYEGIDQSDEACFYLPDFAPGEPAIFPGKCDEGIRGVANFDVQKLIGHWRVIQSYPSEAVGTCNEATYSSSGHANNLTVNAVHAYVVDQTLTGTSGILSVSSTDKSGALKFIPNGGEQSVDYVVLAIDYDSYAFVYQCENILGGQDQFRKVTSWKLGRNNTLDQTANDEINAVIDRINVLNARYFYNVDRSEAGCFYFPEVNDNAPVRFRGRCNESIPALSNFNPDAYQGLWHDIQSYPEVFQNGTCSNAVYTLDDNGVDVYNTQVVNQELDIMRGRAVLASTDGSAKLDVTFNVMGMDVTTNYWVLDTDYTSYSLVYSCRNVGEEYYQVSSWKLSRNRSLSISANLAIDAAIKDIPVLDDRYYLGRDQTESGCFYFPEPEENKPVVFPGQCDEDIDTVQNFNFTEFAGTWHEIGKYPYAVNEHQCIDHRFGYNATSNSLNHNSYHVRDQTLSIVNSGEVDLDSLDVSSKLTINIIVNAQVQTIPFWILATDYNDYALAYGCRNIDKYSRQIYSWKLSRTRQLSAQGAAAIQAPMNTIQVLENRYFDTIQQSDEVCFYLPVLGPNDPVTFIGQCDPNIKAVSNFDAAKYLGRWRLIETYQADFQVGTCSEAEYSSGDNAVIVVNSEVIDQKLNTTTGTAVVASTDGSGKLLVNFPPGTTSSDYWILGTDYESYALVYSCRNIANDRRRVWSWKMSRTNTLTDDSVVAINNIVNEINVLNEIYYKRVNRTDEGCFYYPIPDAKAPVVFPGQCNESIPVVSDFDAAAYLGVWYAIESYPAPFQTGSCVAAEYSLESEDLIRVKNTQVINQRLDTWLGSAVLTTSDGTAKLNVSFNVNGVDVYGNYWVLDTDYETYALVYSCENIDPFRRSVASWKLSRERILLENASRAIDTIIDGVQVLHQEYYFESGHTKDDCFYYPDNDGGDVILNGQCLEDSAVPAVTNFEPAMFAGIWHEVSRFPYDLQGGECHSAEYDFDELKKIFSVTTSFVNNEKQENSTIEATISGDGRGVIRADVDRAPFNQIYILATDYNEYALAYSCRNLENDRKQIYSWKLSRSRSGLSAEANNIIDRLVTSNIDLYEGYYETTKQDYDACFYYPEFDELPGTINLPGPCPNNIYGVPNFNATAYLGKWYETARYPVEPNQEGTCVRADYRLYDGNGSVVLVYNEAVSDRTLYTQSGQAEVASTDGSGELLVQFVVDGDVRFANYYILATDYVSYSLVYSCTNLGNGWRQVSSWKLSRDKSQPSDPTIDSVIATTQGLNQAYYQLTSQSEEDCFYVPFITPDKAPRFRGQCENITGMDGFDVSRYLGWWHEIESYTIDGPHPGECRSSNYEQDGDTYRVVDAWVQMIDGEYLAGTVVATDEGKLIKTMSNGQVQEFYVLDTDYTTYALLYSCENIDTEYRRVWSAKHSKTRSLTEEARNKMAPIIANNDVLANSLYRRVDQNDLACFYYPNITVGEVIIPGQCDSSIPVVENFNMTSFAGKWYHTERYDVVSSSCIGTNYVLRDDTIRVFNVEVVDGVELHTDGAASTDDGAILRYTYPVPGSEGKWEDSSVIVMATDYVGYAVLYNCQNEGQFRRRVYAWKLSRERTISTDSHAAILDLTTRRQELYQPYFNKIEQRPDCPEPNSALLLKTSITVLVIVGMLQWLL